MLKYSNEEAKALVGVGVGTVSELSLIFFKVDIKEKKNFCH